MEREIFRLVMAGANAGSTYKPLSMAASTQPTTKLLPRIPPSLSELQKRMFAEQPVEQQLYKKGRYQH